MSDQAKKSLINFSDSLKTMKVAIDFAEYGLAVGVQAIDAYLPANHDVVHVDYYTNTALASGGSATLSIGYDDITTEPDNLLNDSDYTNFTADANVDGIPRIGTDATQISVGTSDAQLAYEIKTAALTAGKITAIITLMPTK